MIRKTVGGGVFRMPRPPAGEARGCKGTGRWEAGTERASRVRRTEEKYLDLEQKSGNLDEILLRGSVLRPAEVQGDGEGQCLRKEVEEAGTLPGGRLWGI